MKSAVIMTNSPGEVAAWVTPVVRALTESEPSVHISVIVPPCTFASGREVEVLSRLEGVAQTLGPRDYVRFMAMGCLPASFRTPPADGGIVMHLGGDFVHTGLVAKRLRMPALAYTEGLVTWRAPFSAFCVPYERAAARAEAKGVARDRIHVIGNLMVDAVRPSMDALSWRRWLGWSDDGDPSPYILLMPGSRPYELKHVAPLFLRAAGILRDKRPHVRFVAALSPFAPIQLLAEALQPCDVVPEAPGRWSVAVQPEGLKVTVIQGYQHDAMLHASFALTIPGTNTAEMAVLRVPMLVALPLNWPEDIPLEGLPGLIAGVPYVGRKLKAMAVQRVVRGARFAALPNRVANRAIVPELWGVLSPEDIAARCEELLDAPQGSAEAQSTEAAAAMGPSGAAGRFVTVAEGIIKERTYVVI